MNKKIYDAQQHIDGTLVAKMQIEFMNHFRDEYDYKVGLLGVGPMQSFLGLMIKKGYLSVK